MIMMDLQEHSTTLDNNTEYSRENQHENRGDESRVEVGTNLSSGTISATLSTVTTTSTATTTTAPYMKKLRELLVHVGDKSATLEQNLQGLTQALVSDLDKDIPILVEFLFQCVLGLPTRTAVYGTLVALLHFTALKNKSKSESSSPRAKVSNEERSTHDNSNTLTLSTLPFHESEENSVPSFGEIVVNRLLNELEDVLTALTTANHYASTPSSSSSSSSSSVSTLTTTPFGPLPLALRLKLLLRWLTELCNAHLIDPRAVLSLFIEITDHILKSETREGGEGGGGGCRSHKVAETVAYALLTSIPFGGTTFLSTCPELLYSLLTQLEEYITTARQHILPLYNQLLSVWDTTTTNSTPSDIQSTDYLTWLMRTVRVWCDVRCPVFPLILQPWISLDSQLSGPRVPLRPLRPSFTSHTATTTSSEPVDLSHTSLSSFACLMPLFRLFPLNSSNDVSKDQDSDMKRVLREMERFVFEDYVLDLLFLWQDEHKDCIRLLLQLPVTTFDVECALIEILFSQIFRLPSAPLKRVYYGVLLIDLCHARPNTVPTQLVHAILRIFEQLHILDIECFEAFVEWFSFHLNNFSFKWPWDIWKEELTMTTESDTNTQQQQQHHRRAFIEEVILRLVRISYLQNVAQTLPNEFQTLLPAEPQPHFPFVGHTEAENLLSRLRQRESPEQIRVWLEQENPSSLGVATRVELLVACLLHLGSKSFSHLINMLDCYAPLLLNTPHQRLVLNVVWQYWGGYNGRGTQQHLIMTLLKFLAYRIVTPHSLVDWLLSDEFLLANTVNNNMTQSPMNQLFFWEMLNRVLDKTLFTTHTLRTKLHELSLVSQGPQQSVIDLETVKEAYAMAHKEQESVFELTFRRLAEILQAHHDIPVYHFWYHMTLGHLKSLGRRYYRHLGPLIPAIAIHYNNVDSHIREVFTQITSLVTNYS